MPFTAVVSEGGETRDYQEKRREHWIIDPRKRAVLVLLRATDVWREHRPEPSFLEGARSRWLESPVE